MNLGIPLCRSLLPGSASHEIPSPWAEIQRPKQTNNYRPRNRAQLQTTTSRGVGGKVRGGTRWERGERRQKEEEQLCLIHLFSQVEISETVGVTTGEILKINELIIALLGIYPKELQTYVHTKPCAPNVNSSFIHDCPHLEATEMSFRR